MTALKGINSQSHPRQLTRHTLTASNSVDNDTDTCRTETARKLNCIRTEGGGASERVQEIVITPRLAYVSFTDNSGHYSTLHE